MKRANVPEADHLGKVRVGSGGLIECLTGDLGDVTGCRQTKIDVGGRNAALKEIRSTGEALVVIPDAQRVNGIDRAEIDLERAGDVARRAQPHRAVRDLAVSIAAESRAIGGISRDAVKTGQIAGRTLSNVHNESRGRGACGEGKGGGFAKKRALLITVSIRVRPFSWFSLNGNVII
jgi:hypothetical protein